MHNTENPQDVKPVSTTLDEAARQNVQSGVLLLCAEALRTAIADHRLKRGHLRVLGCLTRFMNGANAKAWPSRKTIALLLGMDEATVSKRLWDLRHWGYLIAERQLVEEENGKSKNLLVYTFGKIDHETIRREIDKWVDAVKRTGRAPNPIDLMKSSHPQEQFPPTGTEKFPSVGTPSEKVPGLGEKKFPPVGHSNSYKGTNTHTQSSVCNSEDLGHGVIATADAVTHPKFAISLKSVQMQASLSPELAGVDFVTVCRAAALQWALAIENGQPSTVVVPTNIVGAILGGIRRGQYSAHEHKARVAKVQGKPNKLSRW